MYARPAGMSDEESDEEGFAFHDEIENKNHNSSLNDKKVENVQNGQINFDEPPENQESERRNLEFRVLDACMKGSKDVIDEYLASGHNVNEFLHTGWTLLLYAASAAQVHIIKYLLELGADPNLHRDGFTPLMALCNCPRGTSENCLQSLHLLLEAKANVNATSKRRETALMYASKMRDPEFVLELVKNLRTVNMPDSEGQTALFYAVKANRFEVVEILLAANADILVKDRFSTTPYDIAKTKGFDKITALLDTEGNEEGSISDSLQFLEWRDMFPALAKKDDENLNFDIATILYGMGMDRYKDLFRGMDLKTFLKLTEKQLEELGMDMSVHRKRFIEDLHKLHTKKWDLRSLGAIKKALPFTVYDGVVSLGNAAKQMSIVGSSFRFIKDTLMRGHKENLELSPDEKIEYTYELQKTQDSLVKLKKELCLVQKLAEKIDKETEISTPATYIPKKKSYNWTIALSVTVMAGMFLSKNKFVQKLWSE
ncbi:ankyrin repeat, SAM and basic leucine zipper domain-containing protein 1-like [Belonocnema kinseyi]|uniref:ankyrin repeat, SAM and basic leucine zipper domain-containing protein 1-like n=1 Tax=Belonocnema kinseyi TaxID=2817044 RepID=UPI00143D4430|nr:ankyrin repeat, SAM and basic leucine zipper domain-containing protein 1-like [Belonocnema kinseyi]XP_033210849.1 ankyrin repeat, SAM and basic leucine zipper domain-containing protein 1-like [Belonocnema kinseyi]XP_033210850.1 ankyrin repeat, SAM and basic leucine zipper domain-containing protein 1-like [Belonocnema kinseyi]